MPIFDGTGPNGLGPMTGRRGQMNQQCVPMRQGRRRFCCHLWNYKEHNMTQKEKLDYLKEQKNKIEDEIQVLEKK